jgi:hypothetical protein
MAGFQVITEESEGGNLYAEFQVYAIVKLEISDRLNYAPKEGQGAKRCFRENEARRNSR